MAKTGKEIEKAIKDLEKAQELIRGVRNDIDTVAMAAPDQSGQPADTADNMADMLTAILNDIQLVINTLEGTLKYIEDTGGKPPPTQMPA